MCLGCLSICDHIESREIDIAKLQLKFIRFMQIMKRDYISEESDMYHESLAFGNLEIRFQRLYYKILSVIRNFTWSIRICGVFAQTWFDYVAYP